jgi:hypothetical protein
MPVPVFDLLKLVDPQIDPNQAKVHLAGPYAKKHPLDEFLAGRFEEWQRWQSRKNFERPIVLSLIQYQVGHRWLFAGLFDSHGASQSGDLWCYDLRERPAAQAFRGRLVVQFERPGRAPYLDADRWASALIVHQILPEPCSVADFPGYRAVGISKSTLDTIVRLVPASWRTALASVAGVYLISDTQTGKLYVGSASGEGGIWGRWVVYAQTGHGGNALLRELLDREGAARAADFRFSILEIADIHDSEEAILTRESHWKRILVTRDHGLNAN